MIRDPSDGSVREATKAERGERRTENPTGARAAQAPDTGIRQPIRTDAQERLERSRQWLKDYQEERNARGKADREAGTGLRAGGEGLEQQGDRREAGD